jgi:hypothetical protein
MSRRWRWSLVVIVAAAVLGSFLPGALLGAQTPARSVPALAADPPLAPNGCFIASCGKGSPAPATPTLTLAAVVALSAGAIALAARAGRIRRPRLSSRLPRGTALTLFHPPQFS